MAYEAFCGVVAPLARTVRLIPLFPPSPIPLRTQRPLLSTGQQQWVSRVPFLAGGTLLETRRGPISDPLRLGGHLWLVRFSVLAFFVYIWLGLLFCFSLLLFHGSYLFGVCICVPCGRACQIDSGAHLWFSCCTHRRLFSVFL